MNDLDVLDSNIKTPGGVEVHYKKCGKLKCRCSRGKHLHLAYCYRYMKYENGKYRRKRKYIDKSTYFKIKEGLRIYRSEYSDVIQTYRSFRTDWLKQCAFEVTPRVLGHTNLAFFISDVIKKPAQVKSKGRSSHIKTNTYPLLKDTQHLTSIHCL